MKVDSQIIELRYICDYVSEKIDIERITSKNYISTENMMPNKRGVITSTSLPSVSTVTLYKEGDVLISNIRPYFKKIWRAARTGGCSSDVLCLRSTPEIDTQYFYYLLSQDIFFDYVMSGAKGCKMPRGDKKQIMGFKFLLPPLQEQKRISAILGSLDDKIELNRKMNENLEQQAAALFKHWFVDFEFPDVNGNPYRSSRGKMKESSLGMIPVGWNVGVLSDMVEIKYGKDHKKIAAGTIPIYGSGGIMRYGDTSLYSGESVLIPRKGTLSNLFYVNESFWTVDTIFYSIMKSPRVAKYIYQTLKRLNLTSMNAGSAVPSMTTEILNRLPLIQPDLAIVKVFDKLATCFYEKIVSNNKQSSNLAIQRDALLQQLMNPESGL